MADIAAGIGATGIAWPPKANVELVRIENEDPDGMCKDCK